MHFLASNSLVNMGTSIQEGRRGPALLDLLAAGALNVYHYDRTIDCNRAADRVGADDKPLWPPPVESWSLCICGRLMIDWQRNERLLTEASDAALRTFLSEHPLDTISAVGYVFELWNASEQFDICVNTHAFFKTSLETSRERWPDLANEDETRWNSGDFEFPAGLPGESYRDAWQPWRAESVRLHEIADQEPDSKEVYDGLITISCAALANLANHGMFGDWSKIDFNVSEVSDDIEVVKKRDQQIRSLIAKDA